MMKKGNNSNNRRSRIVLMKKSHEKTDWGLQNKEDVEWTCEIFLGPFWHNLIILAY